jgi:type I restriction enzyme, S subunit
MHEVITNNLDLWTSALLTKSSAGRGSNGKQEAYGIKKLRELILELAMRGRLVVQDPNDESASELLKKVATNKAQMVKEGRIRKERDFPAIAQDEIPFNLPVGWEWSRINDVGHDWGQKTPETDFTYIDVSAIDNSLGVISAPSVLSAFDAPSRARKLVRTGTVIYSTIRPYLKNICVIEEAYSPEPIASTAFAVLHPFQSMPGKFFALYFRSPEFVKYVESVQTGIAYPAINDKQFYSGLVPIPPLAEQHRIVAKVDELMALCDQLEQKQTHSLEAHQTLVETLLGTLTSAASQEEPTEAWPRIANHFDTLFTTEHSIEHLKRLILQLAVTGKLSSSLASDKPVVALLEEIMIERKQLGVNKKEQEYFEKLYQAAKKNIAGNRVILKAIFFCAFITKGTTPASTELHQTGDIPFLKVYNIVNNHIDFDYKPTFISKEVHETKLKRSTLFPGDVIMNIVGPPLGKVAIVSDQYPEWNMNQALAVFRPMGGIYNLHAFVSGSARDCPL